MKFLTSIRPSVIAKRATKKLGAAKNFIGGRSSFFNRGASSAGGSGLGGIAQGKVKPAPNGISNLISNISQTITGGDTNNININKLLGDKLSQFTDKISSGMQVPNLDGLMSSVSGISDFMKSFTDPTALNGITEGFQSVKSSLQETVDLATTVRKVLGKLIKQVNAAPSGGGGGGAGGLLSAGAGLVGAGIAGAAGVGAARKGLGFAKFLASKKSLAMIGLGAAGGAALGAGNAAEAADISTQMRMTDVQPTGGMPADQIALFNSTVERFDKYLEDAKTKQRPTGGGKTSKGTKTQKPPGPGPGPGPGSLNAADVIADTPEEKAFIATVRESEGTAGPQGYNTFFGGSQYGGDLSKKTVSEVTQLQRKFIAEGKGRFYDKGQGKYRNSAAVGAGQFLEPEVIVKEMGLDPTKVYFNQELQNQMILHLAKKRRGVDVSKELTAKDWAILQKEWAGLGEYYGQGGQLGRTERLYKENLSEARKSTAIPAAAQAVLNTNISANTNLEPTYNTTLADAFDPTNPANTGGGGINFINLGSATAARPKPQPKPAQPGNTVAPISACSGYNPVTAAAAAIYGISCAAR